MKRLFSLPFLIGLAVGAALISVVMGAFNEDETPSTYGEPDGEVSDGDVSSFVD